MMIAHYLNVTTQFLMTGENNLDAASTLTSRDERDIEKILENTINQLLNQEGLMFDGKPASPEAIDSISISNESRHGNGERKEQTALHTKKV